MSSPSVNSSSLHDLATSFLSAFTHLSPSSTHLALRSPDCTHIFAPSTVGIPPKSNSAFATHIDNVVRPLLTSFPVTAKEIHVNEAAGQVTIWATGKPEFKAEAMGLERAGEKEEWDYTGEYIFILDVNEEGKVERVLEFLDSKATERLRGLMGRAKRNLGKEGEAW
jgi:hypothetical protein